jgi:hypothetical protein
MSAWCGSDHKVLGKAMWNDARDRAAGQQQNGQPDEDRLVDGDLLRDVDGGEATETGKQGKG